MCKAQYDRVQGKNVSIPHRPHHRSCGRNRKTRGLSEYTVFVEKTVASNLAKNSAPIGQNSAEDAKFRQKFGSVADHFQPRLENSESSPTLDETQQPVALCYSTSPASDFRCNQTCNPSNIRKVLDEKLEQHEKDGSLTWAIKSKCNTAILVAVEHIMDELNHNKATSTAKALPESKYFKDKYEKYMSYFSHGSCIFEFPVDPTPGPPSPLYHQVEGELFGYVDWKLMFPSLTLHCPNCTRIHPNSHGQADCDNFVLHHERTNWSKNKVLFPMWTASGSTIWLVVMSYKCWACRASFAANDARLLSSLPPHIRNCYPCDARFANGGFHLHNNINDDLAALMRTYANGPFVSENMFRKQGKLYERKCLTYLSKNPTQQFVSFEEYRAGIFPPSSDSIRTYFHDSQKSHDTPYGYSYESRYERELQSVEVKKNENIAVDHTFQVIKNYSLPGAKAMFTVNKASMKEFVVMAIVPSTGIKEVSHMLVQIRQKRDHFSPKLLYSDTCPNNDDFWHDVFGADLVTRLGLFHLQHRIVDTLNTRSDEYWKCLVQLKKSLYTYNEDDEANLLQALESGTFSHDKKRWNHRRIDEMRHSKVWKQKCDPYLRN